MKEIKIYTLEDNEGIKYVGKTESINSRFNRHIFDAKNKTKLNKRDAWIKSLLNKGQKPIITIIDIVSETDWVFWEKYWISQFKTWGFDLKNTTDGGEGTYGRIVSNETRNKMSLTKKGKIPKNLRQLIELRKLNTGKGVLQYDLHGVLIKKWNYLHEAFSETGIGNIENVVNKKRNSAGGYIWRYEDDLLTEEEFKIIEIKHRKLKPMLVEQYTLDGEFIREWVSVNEVKKTYSGINAALKNKVKTAGGFLWKYKII